MIAVYILAGFAADLLLTLVIARCISTRTFDSLITQRFQAEAWAAMTPGQRRDLMRLVGEDSPAPTGDTCLPVGDEARLARKLAAPSGSPAAGRTTSP